MTLKTRLGILSGFILAFLVAAPIIILYTAGYRWDFKKHRVQKVGLIYLVSTPEGAHTALNGVDTGKQTPVLLRNLLPGTYGVGVEKDGYMDWYKELPVQSNLTTFAEGIVLVRDTVPEHLGIGAKRIVPAKGDRAILIRATEDAHEATLFDLVARTETVIYRTTAPVTLEAQVVSDPDRILLTIRTDTRRASYLSFRLNDLSETATLTESAFRDAIDEEAKLEAAKTSRIGTDGFEIWSMREQVKEVITRLGEPVLHASPYPDGPYAVFQTSGTVHLIEVDGRGGRNDHLLARGDSMNGFAIDRGGENLYYVARQDGMGLLFVRAIR